MGSFVTMWGGTGDKTGAVTIPGVIEKATFGALGTPGDFMGADGEALASGASKDVVANGGEFELQDLGQFGSVVAGMCIYLSAGGSDVGYYEITNVPDADSVIFVDEGIDGAAAAAASDGDNDYTIGGAGNMADADTGELQALLDFIDTPCGVVSGNAINNLDILINQDTTLDDTQDIDNITGSATTKVRVISTNGSFVDDRTQVEIDTEVELLNGLFDFSTSGASIFVTFENIDYNGGGKDAGRAVNCIHESDVGGLSDNILFKNCIFRGASADGMSHQSDFWTLVGCVFELNGGNGFNANNKGRDNRFSLCVFRDNDLNGVLHIDNAIFVRCIAEGNAGDGINVSLTAELYNCTAENNGGDGIVFDQGPTLVIAYNCTSTNNVGDGFNLGGIDIGKFKFFGNNHAFGNAAHCSEVGDADWADFLWGFNIAGAPDYVSTTSGQAGYFIPNTGSPLIDAGVGGTGDTIGVLCATASAGGGLITHPGMSGGMRG